MKITFDFNERQTEIFKDFMSSGLAALEQQNSQLQAAIAERPTANALPTEEWQRLFDYLNNVVIPQQLVVSEILQTIEDAEHPIYQPKIIV